MSWTSRAVALVAAVLVAFTVAANAAESERAVRRGHVPAPVLKAFAQRWPHATVRGYSRETENGMVFYEVESAERGVTRDVLFKPDGEIAEIEESMPFSMLPAPVREAIAALRPAAAVRTAEKTTRGETTEYEVHVRQGGKARELVFDARGRRIESSP